MENKGKLIVLEGLDGCGKSFHAKELVNWLTEQGKAVLHAKEPSRGQIGLLLRKYLKQVAPPIVDALLFTADRAEHLEREIYPALKQGKIVVCERYVYSTIVYQVAQGLDWGWLKELNSFAPKPDLTILISLRPDIAVKRTSTKEKFETLSFLKKVKVNYEKIAKEENFVVINGGRGKSAVQEDIRNSVRKLI